MMRTQNISRLLVTCVVLAAFLFGQAAALEHAAHHGGVVHTLADHFGDGEGNSGGDDADALCDLSLFAAADHTVEFHGGVAIVSSAIAPVLFNPLATAFLGGVKIVGPPSRGPPLFS